MSFNYLCCVLLTCTLFIHSCTPERRNDTIDLSGTWNFQVDSLDQGITDRWFAAALDDTLRLPGSMLTNGKGEDITVNTKWTGGIWDSLWYKSPEFAKYRETGNVKVSFWLQPLKHYVGVAWYSKKVTIPSHWEGRYAELFFERCHWESTLWVDTVRIGMQNAISAPHIYDLSQWLTPGEHRITVRVDNRIKDIDPGRDAHSLSDNTQTNWNGIIGKMCLTSRPAAFIRDVQIFPDVDAKKVRAVITICNLRPGNEKYILRVSADCANQKNGRRTEPLQQAITAGMETTVVTMEYSMGDDPLLWDEFHPNVYTFTTELIGKTGSDIFRTDFGMKKFTVDGTRFSVNGRPVFLRGTLECAIFPKTGYPSVAVDDWARIYKKCKEYGLNHVRFHSWCPPEAAFIAADREGIYLSVENSAWAHVGDGEPIDRYIYDESERIVRQFGNHPSFCMMPYGNEASGDSASAYLTGFVRYWQAKDPRRVYTSASGFPESPASDYTSSGSARIQWWDAGLNSPINASPPTTDYDWSAYLEKDKPTVSHEIGQWCVYPDFKEMGEYDGVLKPRNFEIFREKLEEHGMIHLADSFLLASGKLQVLCYKADIEAALRTPGFAGFQLLDLHDFPGQGTALVGVLNPFWEEKGYVTSNEYKRFCNTTVPLLRMPKMIYLDNEEFCARAQVTHYGQAPLANASVSWKIEGSDGTLIVEKQLPPTNIAFGINELGLIRHSLSAVSTPGQLTVTLTAGGFENAWNIWVYPAQLPDIPGREMIKVTQQFDTAAIEYLMEGGSVLLTVKKGSVKPGKGGEVPVGFSSIFWNTQWTAFRQPPFTLGILCNPGHPALASFPTEYGSDWQWWDAMSHCNALRLDSISAAIRPIVRIIDDWVTARPLGLIFECKVGKGKLMVSGIDLITDQDNRPESRQLLYSLMKYMAGDDFDPEVSVEKEQLLSFFP